MAAIATWTFGQQAVDAASVFLKEKGSCIDAVQKGINGKLKFEKKSHFIAFFVNLYASTFCVSSSRCIVKENGQLFEGML